MRRDQRHRPTDPGTATTERRSATYRTELETTPDAARAAAVAGAWARTIGSADAEPVLIGLTRRLRSLLHAEPFTAVAAAEVGAAMVDAGLTDPRVLSGTARVLDGYRWALAGGDDAEAQSRLLLAVGWLAAGFAEALRERIQAEHRQLSTRLRHQAYHDPLTGLPNRALLTERISQAFRSPSPAARIGLCLLDLDRFKQVNDAFGHGAGDRLLAAVADRMNVCVSAHGQLLVRIGGDEFVILVTRAGAGATATIAEEVKRSLAVPFRLGTHEIRVSASIGVVERPLAATVPAELFSAADLSMYRAKNAGPGRWTTCDQDRSARGDNADRGFPDRGDSRTTGHDMGCLSVAAVIAQ